MDGVLACYAAVSGSIPATIKCFLSPLGLEGVVSNKMEPDMIKLASSSANTVDVFKNYGQ